jgi:tetratricopeptide (TPR) repeat protein
MPLARLLHRPDASLFCFCLLLTLLSASSFSQSAPRSADDYSVLKQQARDLFKQGKFEDALPIFQKLHDTKPDDVPVLEGLAFCTLTHARTLTDPAARKATRVKARQLIAEARAAGDTSNLIKILTDIPEDGSESPFSSRADVDALMKEGEAIFVKGDLDGAIASYQQALALDPKQYAAALFIGDCYYKKNDHEQAGKWFLQAIQIDPNQETAYRYWGDDLMAQNRFNDAKTQFVQAIVASPYDKRSWVGLIQWANKGKITLAHPAINPPGSVTDKGKNDKGQAQINITIDPSTMGGKGDADGTSSWFTYTLSKAVWHGDRFKKEFPNEKDYRHSLAEEVDGYQMVITQVRAGLQSKKITKLDPALANLLKLSDEGLLEPFVLISKADPGIAQDYPAFRDAHREKITPYINEWIIHPAPQPAP